MHRRSTSRLTAVFLSWAWNLCSLLCYSSFSPSHFHCFACFGSLRCHCGSFPCSTVTDIGTRTGGFCSRRVVWAGRTASLWSSLSWLDKVGRDTTTFIFSFAWGGRRESNKKIMLTATLKMHSVILGKTFSSTFRCSLNVFFLCLDKLNKQTLFVRDSSILFYFVYLWQTLPPF